MQSTNHLLDHFFKHLNQDGAFFHNEEGGLECKYDRMQVTVSARGLKVVLMFGDHRIQTFEASIGPGDIFEIRDLKGSVRAIMN